MLGFVAMCQLPYSTISLSIDEPVYNIVDIMEMVLFINKINSFNMRVTTTVNKTKFINSINQ
jgi:hypothetical protein